MKKKILFAPFSIGIAHCIRSLTIAEEMSSDYEVFFVIDEKKAKILPMSPKINKITIKEGAVDDKKALLKLFTPTKKGIAFVASNTQLYMNILEKYKPDLVVLDLNYFCFIACLQLQIPPIVLTNSLIFPYRKGFVGNKSESVKQWIGNETTSRILNIFTHSFFDTQLAVHKNVFPNPPSLFSFYKNTIYIIPELKEYNLFRRYPPNLHYVGPIIHKRIEERDVAWESKVKKMIKDKKVIYLTFGGTGFGEKLFIKLLRKFLEKGYFVIASAGTVINISDVPIKNQNLLLQQFVPGMSASTLADVIVSHGSYGCVTHALSTGKPMVCIPFNLDHLFHSLKVHELGMGVSTVQLRFLQYLSLTGQRLQKMAEKTNPERVVGMVQEVIDNPSYRQKAQKFRDTVASENGATKAARFIEKFLQDLETN